MSTWNDEQRRDEPRRDRARSHEDVGGDGGFPVDAGARGNGRARDADGTRGDGGPDQPRPRGGRRYPKPAPPRSERTDIYATVFGLGLALLLLLKYALHPLIGGDGVPAKVARVVSGASSVDNGRAVARELISDGAANYLWAAHWLAVAALLVVVLCGAGLARNFLRGDFFTLGSYRWLAAMCWALLFYIVVPGFVGTIGGNMVLRDLGQHSTSIPAIDVQDYVVMWVLLMVLSMIGVAIRRASVLERDTEGLV